MPVQINEIIVKAVVDPGASKSAKEIVCPPAGNAGESELIEQVLEVIKEKKKR